MILRQDVFLSSTGCFRVVRNRLLHDAKNDWRMLRGVRTDVWLSACLETPRKNGSEASA